MRELILNTNCLNHIDLSGMGLQTIDQAHLHKLFKCLANCQTLESVHLTDNDLRHDPSHFSKILEVFAIDEEPVPKNSLKPIMKEFDASVNR